MGRIKENRVITVIVLCLPLIFWLASEPQNPDGAELVRTAQYGTLPHPPGFPILSILHRLALLLPVAPVGALSALSLLCLGLAAFFFNVILERLEVRPFNRTIATMLFLYFPPIALMGLQPEKYALIYLLLTLFFYFYQRRSVLGVGAVLGAYLAHHDSAFFLAPAVGWLLFQELKRERSMRKVSLGMALTLGIWGLAYASLIVVPSGARPWPNWSGELRSLADVWHFITYRDFGFSTSLEGTSLFSRLNLNTLTVLHDNLFAYLTLGYPVILIGGGVELYRRSRDLFIGLLSFVVVACLGLSFVTLELNDYGLGYLDRYVSIPALVLLIFVPFFFEALAKLLANVSSRLVHRALSVSFLLLPALSFFEVRSITSSYKGRILEVYQEEVERDTPNGYLVSANDYLSFYGKGAGENVTYPLMSFFYNPWYRESVAPKLAPGIEAFYALAAAKNPNWNTYDLIDAMVEGGARVYVTSVDLGQRHRGQLQRKGLVWVIQDKRIELADKLKRAADLCGGLKKLEAAVPLEKSYFQKLLLSEFRIFFLDLHLELVAAKDGRAKVIEDVILGLAPGVPLEQLKDSCNVLEAR